MERGHIATYWGTVGPATVDKSIPPPSLCAQKRSAVQTIGHSKPRLKLLQHVSGLSETPLKSPKKYGTQQSRCGCAERYLNKAQARGTPLFQKTTLSQQDWLVPALQRFFIFGCFEHNEARGRGGHFQSPAKIIISLFHQLFLRLKQKDTGFTSGCASFLSSSMR